MRLWAKLHLFDSPWGTVLGYRYVISIMRLHQPQPILNHHPYIHQLSTHQYPGPRRRSRLCRRSVGSRTHGLPLCLRNKLLQLWWHSRPTPPNIWLLHQLRLYNSANSKQLPCQHRLLPEPCLRRLCFLSLCSLRSVCRIRLQCRNIFQFCHNIYILWCHIRRRWTSSASHIRAAR